MSIRPEQYEELKKPFPLSDHYLRIGHGNKGYVTWLTYLTRPAIQDRLFNVLGALVTDNIIDRWYNNEAQYNDQKYSVIVRVSYSDIIYHEAIGTDTDYMSAETRAYKRAASHFGVGMYLYESPTIQTRNTGLYNADTKKYQGSWTDTYINDHAIALSQVYDYLDSLDPHKVIGKANWWNAIKEDSDINKLYNHENHIVNTIKKLAEDNGLDLNIISKYDIKQQLIEYKKAKNG